MPNTSKKANPTQEQELGNNSNSRKDQQYPPRSEINVSKYQPTSETGEDPDMLDSEDGLRKLLCDNLKDLYWAENHLLKALPKMASAASIQALQSGIMKHLEETTQQVKRLEQAFDLLGKPAQAKKCEAMQGLTQEGEAVIETTQPGSAARNLGIIMASQKVEHYEMSAYTGLYKLALKLGEQDVADLLNQTLAEETASDESLAKIAEEI